jgi:hypothetical protein
VSTAEQRAWLREELHRLVSAAEAECPDDTDAYRLLFCRLTSIAGMGTEESLGAITRMDRCVGLEPPSNLLRFALRVRAGQDPHDAARAVRHESDDLRPQLAASIQRVKGG